MVDVSLSVCFDLGRALRYGDARAFFEVYDGFLKEQAAPVDKLDVIKEVARQISELPQDDFVLMHTSFLTSSSTAQAMLVQPTDLLPVETQLTTCLERLRSDTTLSCTSDSGAVSDFDGSTISCEDLSSSMSATTLDDVSTKIEKLEEVNENNDAGTIRGGLSEDDSAIVIAYKEEESLLNEVPPPQFQAVQKQTDTRTNNYQQSNVKRKPPLARGGRYSTPGQATRQVEDQQWRNGGRYKYDPESRGHGNRERRLPLQRSRKFVGKKREKQQQKVVSKSHEEMALFLWKGWQQVQRELAVK